MWAEIAKRRNQPGGEDKDPSDSLSVDSASNVYSFGMIMLETISGRLPYSQEQGSVLDWVCPEKWILTDSPCFYDLISMQECSLQCHISYSFLCVSFLICILLEQKDRYLLLLYGFSDLSLSL